MPLKQFKFTLEFLVNVNDITDETIRENAKAYSNSEEFFTNPDFLENQYRQKRLLHALISDESVLRKYVTQLFPDFLESKAKELTENFLLTHDNYDETVEIEKIAVDKLNKEDKDFFEEVEKKGIFAENAELFYEAISIDLADISISQTK